MRHTLIPIAIDINNLHVSGRSMSARVEVCMPSSKRCSRGLSACTCTRSWAHYCRLARASAIYIPHSLLNACHNCFDVVLYFVQSALPVSSSDLELLCYNGHPRRYQGRCNGEALTLRAAVLLKRPSKPRCVTKRGAAVSSSMNMMRSGG